MPAGEVHRSSFDELSPRLLYDILRLRSEVFVVEQECVFLDLDGRDHEPAAVHLWTEDAAGVSGVTRVLNDRDGVWSIGRVVTRPDVRSTGIAARLMAAAVELVEDRGATTTLLNAQAHLADWYRRFGFEPAGPEFLDDGIPHLPMARRAGDRS